MFIFWDFHILWFQFNWIQLKLNSSSSIYYTWLLGLFLFMELSFSLLNVKLPYNTVMHYRIVLLKLKLLYLKIYEFNSMLGPWENLNTSCGDLLIHRHIHTHEKDFVITLSKYQLLCSPANWSKIPTHLKCHFVLWNGYIIYQNN